MYNCNIDDLFFIEKCKLFAFMFVGFIIALIFMALFSIACNIKEQNKLLHELASHPGSKTCSNYGKNPTTYGQSNSEILLSFDSCVFLFP